MKINFKEYITYETIGGTAILVSLSLIVLYVWSKIFEASALLPPSQMDINTVIRLTFVGGFLLGGGVITILWNIVGNGEQKSDSIVRKE